MENEDWTGITVKGDKEKLIGVLEATRGLLGDKFNAEAPYLKIETPCNEIFTYKTANDIPSNDITCECGKNHQVIKYFPKD